MYKYIYIYIYVYKGVVPVSAKKKQIRYRLRRLPAVLKTENKSDN